MLNGLRRKIILAHMRGLRYPLSMPHVRSASSLSPLAISYSQDGGFTLTSYFYAKI